MTAKKDKYVWVRNPEFGRIQIGNMEYPVAIVHGMREDDMEHARFNKYGTLLYRRLQSEVDRDYREQMPAAEKILKEMLEAKKTTGVKK